MTASSIAPAGSGAASPERVSKAREELDAHVREIVRWHFSPETGSPFWLERARGLGWNPLEEVRGFSDLARLSPLCPEALPRGGPVARWVPRGLAGRPVYVFDADTPRGGIVRRIDIEDLRSDCVRLSRALPDEAFPRGADWLALASTGPRRLRHAVEILAQDRGGIAFGLDLDPRWVEACLRRGAVRSAEAYKGHVIDQALTILRAHPNIRCLFTTPRLLDALAEKVALPRLGITGVAAAGQPMSSEWLSRTRREILGRAALVGVYANTLLGFAWSVPRTGEDSEVLAYHAPQPRGVLEVVDPQRPERLAPYGARGRLRITTLTRDFFLPGLIERDEAVRTPPVELYPWDGAGDIRPGRGAGAAEGSG